MKVITLKKKPVELEQFVKRSALESDYDILITEPTILIDEDDGEIKFIYDYLGMDTSKVVQALNSIKYPITKRVDGLKTQSRVFGFKPRVTMRADFCSSTSLAIQHPKEHQTICDLALDIEKQYEKYHPEGYEKHSKETEGKIKEGWRINGKSVFTSGIINKNNPLKYHFDTGNFLNVYSCMVVFKGGVSGGFISLPEYRAGVELRDNSLFMFDGQSILHGVTPIKKHNPNSYRYSIVYYSLRQMWKCLTIDEEVIRIRQRKTKRELLRAKPTEDYNKKIQKHLKDQLERKGK